MPELGIYLLLSALIAWLATWLCIRYAANIGLLHQPNHRSSHHQITPHGGGVGIVISSILFTLWLVWKQDVNYLAYTAAIGLALMVSIKGLLDDIFHLPPWTRLLIQIIICTALLIILYNLPINGLEPINGLPQWLSFILILLAAVWWLNLFNFMDGIDGLAASQAIFMLAGAALLIALQQPEKTNTTVWSWTLCLAAATFGFLLHNWSPAKIFLGDTGSLFLAFMILLLALLTISLQWMNYASWAILGAIFISDASLTLLKRLLAGENITLAHRQHAYQKLARSWQSHQKVTLLIIAINLFWLLPLAWLALQFPKHSHFYLLIAYLPLSIWAWDKGRLD